MQHLELARPAALDAGIPVIALAHNEANLVGPFLQHYRRLGPVHFVILDDRSTDGTREMLEGQPDVTLYRPAAGSRFAEHKYEWRQSLLGAHAVGRWALLPDLDELFVHAAMERRSFGDYLSALDREGAEGVLAVMIDMYADRPLKAHRFPEGTAEDLVQAFPFFDGAGPAPLGYHFRYPTPRTRRAAPTPPLSVHGGMRDRLFRIPRLSTSPAQLAILDRIASLDGPVTPRGRHRLAFWLARHLTKGFFRDAMDAQKIGLIRWRPGLLYRNAHSLRHGLRLSESICAFLHFKFTRGAEGIDYIARRGQHFAGSVHYRQMLSSGEVLERSPVFEGSRRYEGSGSLRGIVRDVPPHGTAPPAPGR